MASGWISKKARKNIYTRDAMKCCYCGKECKYYDKHMDNDTVTLDHIVSQKELAASATDDAHFNQLRRDAKNLVVVCNGCNAHKKATPLFVWCKQTGKDYNAIIAEIAKRTA